MAKQRPATSICFLTSYSFSSQSVTPAQATREDRGTTLHGLHVRVSRRGRGIELLLRLAGTVE
jgi:hypothetical protein